MLPWKRGSTRFLGSRGWKKEDPGKTRKRLRCCAGAAGRDTSKRLGNANIGERERLVRRDEQSAVESSAKGCGGKRAKELAVVCGKRTGGAGRCATRRKGIGGGCACRAEIVGSPTTKSKPPPVVSGKGQDRSIRGHLLTKGGGSSLPTG